MEENENQSGRGWELGRLPTCFALVFGALMIQTGVIALVLLVSGVCGIIGPPPKVPPTASQEVVVVALATVTIIFMLPFLFIVLSRVVEHWGSGRVTAVRQLKEAEFAFFESVESDILALIDEGVS